MCTRTVSWSQSECEKLDIQFIDHYIFLAQRKHKIRTQFFLDEGVQVGGGVQFEAERERNEMACGEKMNIKSK